MTDAQAVSAEACVRAPLRDATCRAVLDSLREAIFFLDAARGLVEPLNLAASDWIAMLPHDRTEIRVADVFPELAGAIETAGIGSLTRTSIVVRASKPGSSDAPRGIEIRVSPVVGEAASENDTGAKFILIADNLDHGTEGFAGRDALDDAFHDPLTRLANRRLFQRRLERAIQRASSSNYHFAVLFVDLDRFKEVNDRFGHLQGDRVLLAAAHRLVEAVRPQDMVARRDGDEFTILLDDLERAEDAVHVAQRIVDRLQAPLVAEGPAAPHVNIGASVGIAMASDGAMTAEELIARADQAMYQAKALGGGMYMTLDRPASADGNVRKPAKRRPR